MYISCLKQNKKQSKRGKQMKQLRNLESLEAVYIYISVFYKINKKKMKHKAILQYVNLVYLLCTN